MFHWVRYLILSIVLALAANRCAVKQSGDWEESVPIRTLARIILGLAISQMIEYL